MIGETESARPSINLMTATEVGSGGVAAPAHGRTQSRHHAHVLVYRSFPVLALLILPSFLRLWQLDRVGFNSDEAVHSGTAAARPATTRCGRCFRSSAPIHYFSRCCCPSG
jgi:hypothetical protein